MNNKAWLQRSLDSVWHPCTQMKQHPALPLVPIARGEGIWLEDFEGKRYLDLLGVFVMPLIHAAGSLISTVFFI